MTYLERYTLQSMLGLATADLPDADDEQDPAEKVDAARNLKAVGWLQKKGISAEYASEHLGKPVDQWTGADLDELKRWATASPGNGEVPPDQEPPERDPGEEG